MLIKFVGTDGSEIIARGEEGDTLLTCAKNNAVTGIIGECGGAMACATCHGYIDTQWVDKLELPSESEKAMLSGCLDVRENSRLTCQIVLSQNLDGLTVYVPESQI